MEVKILGTGCPKCKRLEELAREAAAVAPEPGEPPLAELVATVTTEVLRRLGHV